MPARPRCCRARLLGALAAAGFAQPLAGQPDSLAPAFAQSVAGQPDSLAAFARARYRAARAAEQAGELRRARALLAEAARAWPVQPAYPLAAAELSARLADTAAAVEWLGRLADLGGGLRLADHSALATLAAAPALAAVATRLGANLEPLRRSDRVAGIADPEFFPEGMDHDPGSGSWLVTSIRRRTIARIAPDGRVTDFPALTAGRLDAVLGVRVDAARGVVWATTRTLPTMEDARPDQPARARVWAFALATGAPLGSAELGAGHLLGDLVVHSSGAVYLSDSETPVVFRARLVDGRVALEEAARHRLFRSLQGLAFDPTERHLYLADYSHGLLRLELATGRVEPVPGPPGVSTLGLDGIARVDAAIIGIQNGVAPPRVVRLRLTAEGGAVDGLEVLDRHLPIADEPTIGAVVGDRFVYIANSQWEKYDPDGRRRPGAVLRGPVLLAVPIGR